MALNRNNGNSISIIGIDLGRICKPILALGAF